MWRQREQHGKCYITLHHGFTVNKYDLINLTEGMFNLLNNYYVSTNWLCHIDKGQSEHKNTREANIVNVIALKISRIRYKKYTTEDAQCQRLFPYHVPWYLQNITHGIRQRRPLQLSLFTFVPYWNLVLHIFNWPLLQCLLSNYLIPQCQFKG